MKSWIIVATGIISIVVFVTYATALLLVSWPIEDWSIAKASLFGDSFGVLNSFFTGGAFLLILWTIVLQQQELRLQRKEMSRMVAAHHRELHMDLLNYAFDDPDLAEVWGDRNVDYKVLRKYMYVNLILNQMRSSFEQGLSSREQISLSLEKRMRGSEYFRRFWVDNGNEWIGNSQDEKLKEFQDLCNAAYGSAVSQEI